VKVPPDRAVAGPRRAAVRGIVAGCAVLLLLGAGVLAGFGPQVRADRAVSAAFYAGDARPGWLEALLQVVTAPGLSVVRFVVFLPVVLVLARRGRWRTVLWVAAAVVLVGPLTTLLKDAFGRLRPQFAGGGAQLSTPGFPSGHSSGIATLVTVALVLSWPLLGGAARRVALALGAVVVVVVGLSRMWLGVHYLTDVLGGWAFGGAWSLAVALALGGLPGGPAALPGRVPAAGPAEPAR
jgi:membrane-associated phospholipid phosphatase